MSKTFIVRLEVNGLTDREEFIRELKKEFDPFGIKVTRVWEPDESRVCNCGKFALHVRWSPEQGESWLCCDCWVAEGNAPTELHKSRR